MKGGKILQDARKPGVRHGRILPGWKNICSGFASLGEGTRSPSRSRRIILGRASRLRWYLRMYAASGFARKEGRIKCQGMEILWPRPSAASRRTKSGGPRRPDLGRIPRQGKGFKGLAAQIQQFAEPSILPTC